MVPRRRGYGGVGPSPAMSSPTADALARTQPERVCLDALREATATTGGALERHCVRVFVLTERMAAGDALPFDRERMLCACLLHDLGLYPPAATGDVYVRDSRRLAERLLAPFGWPPERLSICLDAIEHHHELRSQWHRGTDVELLRRADLVDASAGVLAYGLPRGWLRGLFRAVPRKGFYAELVRITGRALRDRPATIPRIFAP